MKKTANSTSATTKANSKKPQQVDEGGVGGKKSSSTATSGQPPLISKPLNNNNSSSSAVKGIVGSSSENLSTLKGKDSSLSKNGTPSSSQTQLHSSKIMSSSIEGKANSVEVPKATNGGVKSNIVKQNHVPSKQISSVSNGDKIKTSKNLPLKTDPASQKDKLARSITKSPGITNSQPKESKSLIVKPTTVKSSKSSHAAARPTFPKFTFKDIPSDVIIIIFDFYGGIFKNKPLVCGKEGKLDYSKFIKKYYGRFLDKTVKFQYRFIEGEFETNTDPREIAEILRIPLLTLNNRSIKLEGNIASYLFNCPLKLSAEISMQKLTNFISQLGEECKRVKVLDTVNLETVVSQFELAFKSFPFLEVIRGGKNMIKAKYTDHAARFHYFEEEMIRALEHGGSNVKEIMWIGSPLPKSLPFITPNLEILSLGKFFTQSQ